jgi:hypothetical protein
MTDKAALLLDVDVAVPVRVELLVPDPVTVLNPTCMSGCNFNKQGSSTHEEAVLAPVGVVVVVGVPGGLTEKLPDEA